MNSIYYNKRGYGGNNPCILGNTAKLPRNNECNVLPNCVGWVVGRFNEILGLDKCPYLASVNANRLIDIARSQGLQVGNTPKQYSVAVWDNGDCGHCAIVEQIIDRNTIQVSESGWNGSNYYWGTILNNSNGNWNVGESWLTPYKLLGFIYLPDLIDRTMPSPVSRDVNKTQVWIGADNSVNCRLKPTINSESIGYIPSGFYNITYNIEHNDGYVWYELVGNKWVAIMGNWSMIYPQEENIEIKQETAQNEEKQEDSIIETPKINEKEYKEEEKIQLEEPIKEQKTLTEEHIEEKKESWVVKLCKFILQILKNLFGKSIDK